MLTRKRVRIPKFRIVGCGIMDSGITQLVLQSVYQTIVWEVSQKLLDRDL